LPPLFGLAAKLSRSRLLFTDYQAVACAGQKALSGQAYYALDLSCPGMHAASFVYLPAIAHFTAALQSLFGASGFFLVYLGLYLVATMALVLIPLRTAPLKSWRDQIPFLSFLSGSALTGGNIAVLLHGSLLISALLWFDTAPWLFIAAIVMAAWVKPVFLCYLAVILVSSLPWRTRLIMMAASLAAGLIPCLVFAVNGGTAAQQWMSLLAHFVYQETPGRAWFGWLQLIGIAPSSLTARLGYFVFAALMAGSGLMLSLRLDLSRQERLWFGFTLAVLLIPRLMSEDVYLLGPGMVLAAARATRAGVTPRGNQVVLGLCGLCLLGGLTTLADIATPLAVLGFALYLMWAALVLGLRAPMRIVLPSVALARFARIRQAQN
jgi:hypothetical protein